MHQISNKSKNIHDSISLLLSTHTNEEKKKGRVNVTIKPIPFGQFS